MLKPADYETSIAGWSFALAEALDSYDIDSLQVFNEAGIDLAAVESASARLPVSSVQQVWRYAENHTDDYFGIQVSKFLTPASLHALGFGLWCSSSLRDYFERYIRYRCVLSHMHFCELIEREDHYLLNLVDERAIKSEITQDAAVGFFLRMASALYGSKIAPRAVYVTRSLDKGAQRLREFYGREVRPNSDAYGIEFDKSLMEHPLRFANPALAAQQDMHVEHYIAEHGLISEYMLRVRTAIQELLHTGDFGIEQVASRLNVTVRTLQRRLSSENCAYNHLLEEVRTQKAVEYARDPAISASEIAFRLGFNDSGSFGRSFKRWTGQSFTDYRSKK